MSLLSFLDQLKEDKKPQPNSWGMTVPKGWGMSSTLPRETGVLGMGVDFGSNLQNPASYLGNQNMITNFGEGMHGWGLTGDSSYSSGNLLGEMTMPEYTNYLENSAAGSSFWDPKNWGMNGYGGLLLGGANLLGGIFNSINAIKYAKEALGLQKEQLAMAEKQRKANEGIVRQNYQDTVIARTAQNNGRYGDEAKADALVALNALDEKMKGVA
jgi:hypothetical protein